MQTSLGFLELYAIDSATLLQNFISVVVVYPRLLDKMAITTINDECSSKCENGKSWAVLLIYEGVINKYV